MTSSAIAGPPPLPDATGVYCLANDEVLEWFQAFVRSLRKHDPQLPLTVIPYDASLTRIRELQGQFHFKLMDQALLVRFDEIAGRVAGQHHGGGTFRKLGCFFGEYDLFLFLDSDIVVTRSLAPFLRAFDPAACDFVYFDKDMTQVYTAEFARQMVAEYDSHGFNSGAFIARRGSITDVEIRRAAESGEKIRDRFSIWGEQPFFNYLFDVSRRRKLPASALLPETADLVWAVPDLRHDTGQDTYFDRAGRVLPLIHWAGYEFPDMVRPEIFLRHRTLGMAGLERAKYRLEFYRGRYHDKFKKSQAYANLAGRLDSAWRKLKQKLAAAL